MALAAARTVLGEVSEVRDIRFEQMLLLNDQTPIAAVASVEAPGVVDFAVETQNDGEQRDGPSRFCAPPRMSRNRPGRACPPCSRRTLPYGWGRIRQWWDTRGVQLGPAFAGLIAAHTAENASTLVAEVGLPGSVRSQHGDYGVHPALLDACFSPSSRTRQSRMSAAACCCR